MAATAAAPASAGGFASFHDLEHSSWTNNHAAYNDYWGPLTSQCIPSVLSSVGCGAGVKFLDVATGPGFVAEAAARAGAEVVALDFSAPMLEIARERLAAASLGERVRLVEADAARMPLPDASFDAVACCFGVLHLPDPDAFLREAFRVLRPGGRLAFTVWAEPPKAQALDMIQQAIKTHGNADVGLPPGPPFYRFADPVGCVETLTAIGFEDARCQEVSMTWELSDPGDAFVAFRDGTGRTAAILAAQTPEQLAAVESAMRSGAEAKRAGPGGPIRFTMPCAMTEARKPAA